MVELGWGTLSRHPSLHFSPGLSHCCPNLLEMQLVRSSGEEGVNEQPHTFSSSLAEFPQSKQQPVFQHGSPLPTQGVTDRQPCFNELCPANFTVTSSLIREPTGVVFSICSSFLASLGHTSHGAAHSWCKEKRISLHSPRRGFIIQYLLRLGSSHLKGQTVCFTMCGIDYVNIVNKGFQELI